MDSSLNIQGGETPIQTEKEMFDQCKLKVCYQYLVVGQG